MKNGGEITLNMGYQVYSNQNELNPAQRGFITDYKLTVLDSAIVNVMTVSTAFGAALATAYLL